MNTTFPKQDRVDVSLPRLSSEVRPNLLLSTSSLYDLDRFLSLCNNLLTGDIPTWITTLSALIRCGYDYSFGSPCPMFEAVTSFFLPFLRTQSVPHPLAVWDKSEPMRHWLLLPASLALSRCKYLSARYCDAGALPPSLFSQTSVFFVWVLLQRSESQ